MYKLKYPVFFLIVILGFVYWQWWLSGPRVANDLPLVSLDSLKSQMDFPRTWTTRGAEGLGEYTVFTIWSWPFNLLSGILANFGLDLGIQERILVVIPMLIFGAFGIWKVSEILKLSSKAKLVSSIFYLTNTYLILLLDGGQLSIALTLAWLPISFYAIEKAISGNLYQKILAGLSIWVLGFLDIRFIFVLFLLLLVRFIYGLLFLNRREKVDFLKANLLTGLTSFIILFGLNFYWILPIIKAPLQQGVYQQLTQVSQFSNTSLAHTIFLISPNWYENKFGKVSPIRFEFVLIPILVFAAMFLKRKDYWLGFWTLVAIISLFLAKGFDEPFGFIYNWLFIYIPGFSLFRDSTKFFSLVILAYSLLIGITVDQLIKLAEKTKSRILVSAVPIAVVIYLIFVIKPVWLGQMLGTFSAPKQQSEYSKVGDLLKADDNFSRVFWIPTVAALGYSSATHPSVEATRFYGKRPFSSGIVGTYEIFNFLRESSFVGQLFDVLGIGYVIYPMPISAKVSDLSYYDTFLNQIKNLPWVSKEKTQSTIPVLKTNSHQNKIFLTQNLWWVIGPENVLNESTKSANLSLSKNSFVFAEQSALGNQLQSFPNAKVILNSKDNFDITASFIDTSNFLFPSAKLQDKPNSSGWWKRDSSNFLNWRDFLQTKYGIDNDDFDYGGGWAISEGHNNLTINPLKSMGQKVLLVRYLKNEKGGNINFYQDDKKIGSVDSLIKKPETTKIKFSGYQNIPDRFSEYSESNFSWAEVGQLESDLPIRVESVGNLNMINAFAFVTTEQLNQYKKQTDDLIKQGRVIKREDLADQTSKMDEAKNLSKVSFKEINPTYFRVTVSGLTVPETVVFSESYDPRWELNGKSSIPIFGLINGFKVNKDGEYDLIFTPQKYLDSGFILSCGFFVGILILLFLLKRKYLSYN